MKTSRLKLEEEDVTSQAGWLFADSFLALMIIFLATISFVPALTTGVVLGSASVGTVAGTNYSKGLVLVYDKIDALEIEREIRKYLESENLPSTAEVIYARIVGSYSDSESIDDGKIRAIEVSVALKKAGIKYFENTSFDLTASNQIKSGTFVLRLTLAFN